MNKRDYQNYMREYIDSLEASGTIATADRWHIWIREEANEKRVEITGEEIDWLVEVLENEGYVIGEKENMSIKTLEREGYEDCISRQAVHEAIERWAGSTSVLVALPTREVRPLLDSIHELPPAMPQPKTGKWIRVDKDKCKCDQCEVIAFIGLYPNGDKNYCPNCGAQMQEVEK